MKQRSWASNACPTSSSTPLFHSDHAHCWQNNPKHTFFWGWVSGILCLTSRREEAHLSQEEMELPSRKRNQRTEDSQPVPWCKCGKKPRQNGSVDSRNLRKKKKKLVSIWVTPLLREGNWYYFLLIRTCLHGAGAQSFIGDLLAFGNRLRMLSSLCSPPSLDHDPGYRQTE